MSRHFLVVGLGNYPFPLTRHSVGQYVLDSFASRLNAPLTYNQLAGGWTCTGEVTIPPKVLPYRKPNALTKSEDSPPTPLQDTRVKITLLKPKMLMNVSGKSISLALKSSGSPACRPTKETLILVHDSLSHKPLAISPKPDGGSANGHNGVKSTIASLSNFNAFGRLRLGIGRPENKDHVAAYVLHKMSRDELEWWGDIGEGSDKAWAALLTMIRDHDVEKIKIPVSVARKQG